MVLSEEDFAHLLALYHLARGQPSRAVPISVSLRLSKFGFVARDNYGDMRITPSGWKYVRDRVAAMESVGKRGPGK